jgi:tRNA acetyltransferase TAN1
LLETPERTFTEKKRITSTAGNNIILILIVTTEELFSLSSSSNMSETGKAAKRKKHNKSYYINQAKRKKREFILEPGLKGILITCMNKERNCIHEAYNILNEYADKLYGPEETDKDNDSGKNDSDDEDIQKSLEREIKTFKQQPARQRRFQIVESSVSNCLFIRTTVEDPCELIHKIMSDIEETGVRKSRYIQRMLPVSVTCKAHPKDIVKAAEPLIEQYFGESESSEKSYYITTRVRSNTSADLKQVLPDIVSLMQSKYSKHKVDYKTPELVISVEVLCKVACITILKDFHRLRKYNIQEVAAVIFKDNKNLVRDKPLLEELGAAQAASETVTVETPDVENTTTDNVQKTVPVQSEATDGNGVDEKVD